ncbi:MAG TPA: cobalamin-dependent protein, partial [Verrucomicrobiae bacterium]|nr:cobalamin-dependent protein [Verrucomicrobiae bacterium]
MKVLLVRPRPHPKTIGLQSVMICEPLELEYLAAAVKGRHQVELVDMILERRPLGHFIREHRPRVVGITAYIAHVNVVKEYARVIKEIDPGIAVVVGGVHAEVVPGDFASEHIDHVISRDPIRSFSRLVDSLEIGGISTIAHDRALTKTDCASGTDFNSGCDRMYLSNNSSDLGDLAREEAVPGIFPDRSITAKYRSKYYYVFHNPCALIKTSYGCPFSCNFCFCREVTGGRYFVRELTEVMEELKQISEPEVYIVDDNFLYD